jgi:transposase
LRDRVIDAVKRGEMSRRAAARRYEISESVAIKWLERVERDGSREPERDAQTAADLARAQQLAEEARQLMRALSARIDQLIDRRTVNLEARARQITGGAAVEFVLARRGTSPSASTAG